MNFKINELLIQLEKSRSKLIEIITPLSQKQFDRKPDEEQWSVGEILDHLYMTEIGIIRILNKQIQRAINKKIGPDTNKSSVLNTLDQYNLTKVTKKVKAPESAQPSVGKGKTELLEMLESSRSNLLETMNEATKYDLTQLIFPHPMIGKMDMYQWILFIDQHEQRHTKQ